MIHRGGDGSARFPHDHPMRTTPILAGSSIL
jgi:hypothetical protein